MASRTTMASSTEFSPNSGLSMQVLSSLIVSASTFHVGMCTGWLSPMSLKLGKENSPVDKMTNGELAILGALPSYASLLVTFLMSYLAQRFGRKIAFHVIGFSGIISGLILTFAPSKTWLYIGGALTSVTFAALNVALMYIAETVHGSIRGTFLSASTLLFNCGILFSYIFGAALSYKAYNSTFFLLPAAYTVASFWLPETPYFLVENSKFDLAVKSMVCLRGGNQQVAEVELQYMKTAASEYPSIFEVMKKASTRRALIVSTLAYAFQTLSGIYAVLNYAGTIFKEAGSPLSPETSSIVTGSILVVATLFNVVLIDRLGRKPLLYLSFVGSALSMTLLTGFLYYQRVKGDNGGFGWIPITSLSLFIVVYGLGLTAVPGTIMNEISSTSIRPAIGAVVDVVSLSLISAIIQSFPVLDENFGLYSVFAIPSFFNVVGIAFTRFMVPETKGKSLV